MRTFLLLIFVSVALTATPVFAAGEVVFKARVGDLGIRLKHQQAGTPDDHIVEVVLPGQLYASPRDLAMVTRAEARRDTPEAALQSDFSAWKADDVEWIVGNFAEADRAALQEFLNDADMREANRARFMSDDTLFVWGVVHHGDYQLVLFNYAQSAVRARGLVATFIEEGGGWRVTNALSADETMDVIWTAFKTGEMTAR